MKQIKNQYDGHIILRILIESSLHTLFVGKCSSSRSEYNDGEIKIKH